MFSSQPTWSNSQIHLSSYSFSSIDLSVSLIPYHFHPQHSFWQSRQLCVRPPLCSLWFRKNQAFLTNYPLFDLTFSFPRRDTADLDKHYCTTWMIVKIGCYGLNGFAQSFTFSWILGGYFFGKWRVDFSSIQNRNICLAQIFRISLVELNRINPLAMLID